MNHADAKKRRATRSKPAKKRNASMSSIATRRANEITTEDKTESFKRFCSVGRYFFFYSTEKREELYKEARFAHVTRRAL